MKRFLLFCLCAILALMPGSAQTIHTQTIAHRGGRVVADAFMRIYGVDIKKAGALNGVYLKVNKIG